MAKLSDLIEVFSKTLSVPTTTVEAYVKVIRKEGMLTTGGRGRGAPDITSDDCAKILVAMMAGSPTYAIGKLQEFGKLRCFSGEPGDASRPIFDALKLQPGHSFLEGVAALISHSVETDPAEIARCAIRRSFVPPEGSIDEFGAGSLRIQYPSKQATIRFFLHYHEPTGRKTYTVGSQEAFLNYMSQKYWDTNEFELPNMTTEVSVNFHAVNDLGVMLSDK